MSKTKAIVILTIIIVIIIGLALLIFPLNGEDSFPIGKSNYDFFWISKSIKLGLDLEGGMYAIYEADLTGLDSQAEIDKAMEGTIANLKTLLFSKGYTEATVTRQGEKNIRVEIPAVSDTEQLIQLLGEPAKLEFKDESGNVLIVGSKHLEDASAMYYNGSYAVSLSFNSDGTKAFAEATQANLNKKIIIYVNGEQIIDPTVNSAITDGNAIITGNYTYEQANKLAVQLKAGTFEVPLKPKQTSTISATLGQNALKISIMAGFIGLAAVIVFMLLVYRGLGVMASVALLLYTELLVLLLAIVPWVQLTLPGIAGVILSIGMAVDANVLIFERMKDERRINNKSIPSSVRAGFKSAMVAIVDSNITTILGAIVMMIFGSTEIQSFGISLIIGVALSMFTAVTISRVLVNVSLAFNDTNEIYYGLRIREAE